MQGQQPTDSSKNNAGAAAVVVAGHYQIQPNLVYPTTPCAYGVCVSSHSKTGRAISHGKPEKQAVPTF
ncbi:unnamed protein product [[Candida] boidinii]|nr:unnamed protein product [[Candida] boidinii]